MSILKVYIEPASLPLTYQLADYVKNIDNPDIYSIIVFERLKLNINNFNNGRTVFIDNVNNNLVQKLDKIAKFIINKPLTGLEIHTNIYRESDILFPLMKRIAPHFALEKIQLHLYDDGVYTMQERASLSSFDGEKLDMIAQKRKDQLLAILLNNDSMENFIWNVVDNYIWHYFMNVKYYFIKSEALLKTESKYFRTMSHHVEEINFDLKGEFTKYVASIWRKLLDIPSSIQSCLKKFSYDKDAMLVLTGYCVDREKINCHHRSLMKKIEYLKKTNVLPVSTKIVYKGHPENKTLNKEIEQILGKDITIIPDYLPVEYLYISKLLPNNICGAFGTAFFSMPNKNIKFVFMNSNKDNEDNIKLTNLVNDYKCFDIEKIIYLNEEEFLDCIDTPRGDIQ
jgi:hypothetical protein